MQNTMPPPKKPAGTRGRPYQATTNGLYLSLQPNTPYYLYDIRINAVLPENTLNESRRKLELTKRSHNDFDPIPRRKICQDIFTVISASWERCEYDGCSKLISTRQIPDVLESAMFRVDLDSLNEFSRGHLLGSGVEHVEVQVAPTENLAQVSSNDIAACTNYDFKGGDRGLLGVLDLCATAPNDIDNQLVSNSTLYSFNRNLPPPEVRGGISVEKGITTRCQIVEGNNSKPDKPTYAPIVFGDIKRSGFHKEELLSEKLRSKYGTQDSSFYRRNNDSVSNFLRGLVCVKTYLHKRIRIGGVSSLTAAENWFDINGKRTNTVQYFKDKYGIDVDPRCVCVFDEHRRNDVIPVTCLTVVPHQRVDRERAGTEYSRALSQHSITPANVRRVETQAAMTGLGLTDNQMGISVPSMTNVKVDARILPSVDVRRGANVGNGRMPMNKFMVPAKVTNWAVLILGQARIDDVERFLASLEGMCKSLGIQIARPSQRAHIFSTMEIDQTFNTFCDAGVQFVLAISNIPNDHDYLKFAELQYGICTQEVLMRNIGGGPTLLKNLALKINTKNGGINCYVTSKDERVNEILKTALIIGITTSKPRKDRDPARQVPVVLGWSANVQSVAACGGKQEIAGCQFVPQYLYANPTHITEPFEESLHYAYRSAIVNALKLFKANRKIQPKDIGIIVYRGGISDDERVHVLREEYEWIKEACTILHPSFSPPISIIAVSDDNTLRLHGNEENVPPSGLVVDKTIVNPEINEFALVAQNPRMGTARPTKYALLVEDTKGKKKPLTMDEQEALAFALCHLHQVSEGTTSLPTPVNVAKRALVRGLDQYHHQRELAAANRRVLTVIELNELYTISNEHHLIGTRFNA